MEPVRKFFFITLALFALSGTAVTGSHLFHHVTLWPLIRFAAFSCLFVYALLMLVRPR